MNIGKGNGLESKVKNNVQAQSYFQQIFNNRIKNKTRSLITNYLTQQWKAGARRRTNPNIHKKPN